jgi:phosphonate transport system substrate-binding protein
MKRLVFATGPIARAPTRRQPRRAFAMRLSKALDTEVVVIVASTYNELAGLVERGEAQVAWLPPAVYVQASERSGVELLLRAVRRHGAEFRGALFVRSDAPWREVEDLAGRTVGWVDRESCAGYLYPRLALVDRGLDPDKVFGREVVLGSHEAVVRAVEAGMIDVGATFIDEEPSNDGPLSMPGWSSEVPPEGMRPILVSPPIPADTICAVAGLDPELRDAVKNALLSFHETPEGADIILGLFGADRFERTEHGPYADIVRAMGLPS